MMQTAMIILSITSASIAGSALGYWGLTQHEEHKVIRSFYKQAGAQDGIEARHAFLEIGGIWRQVILFALSPSQVRSTQRGAPARFWLFQKEEPERLLKKSGLTGKISLERCAQVREVLSLGGAAVGLIIGMMLSGMLAAVLSCLGFIIGYRALNSALKQEVEARTNCVEQELSQFIEVLVLGLRSGLSFDRSLELYCHYFSCGLSDLCERLRTQWNHGLITREEGLRTLAASYDSPLLERIMESIIRALRFGTSLAETLSSAGAEIRATRKTKLEEKVAKAPVKMLIPIGTLILPAMLILILGPVILELIGGF